MFGRNCKIRRVVLRTSDFDYDLPPELIAQHPSASRDGSRLLVIDRARGKIEHRCFTDFPQYLAPGDMLALNDTRVFPARLTGNLPGGAQFEVLLVRPLDDGRWLALVRPGRRMKAGRRVEFGDGELTITVEEFGEEKGERIVRLEAAEGLELNEVIERWGHIPLPPYIERDDTDRDRERYQTVYAANRGAVAAPTAGLHFTGELLDKLVGQGIEQVNLTLHVGPGTFRPVSVEDLDEHVMDREFYRVERAAWDRIISARQAGKKLVAVGTTSVRTLESAALSGKLEDFTRLFITPGFEFKVVDRMLTNFHLPCSTLLMLVSALAGRELVLEAYRQAVREKYRFYSYGDAMLIL